MREVVECRPADSFGVALCVEGGGGNVLVVEAAWLQNALIHEVIDRLEPANICYCQNRLNIQQLSLTLIDWDNLSLFVYFRSYWIIKNNYN